MSRLTLQSGCRLLCPHLCGNGKASTLSWFTLQSGCCVIILTFVQVTGVVFRSWVAGSAVSLVVHGLSLYRFLLMNTLSLVEDTSRSVTVVTSRALFGKTIVGWGFTSSPLIVIFTKHQIKFELPGGKFAYLQLRDRLIPIRDIVVNSNLYPYYLAIRPNFQIDGLSKSYNPLNSRDYDSVHDLRYLTLFFDENIEKISSSISKLSEKFRCVLRPVTPELVSRYDPFHSRSPSISSSSSEKRSRSSKRNSPI